MALVLLPWTGQCVVPALSRFGNRGNGRGDDGDGGVIKVDTTGESFCGRSGSGAVLLGT